MGYIVMHFNTTTSGGIATENKVFTALNDAEYRYHLWLSASSQSSFPCDGVAMLTSEGEFIKKECFYHDTTPEPTPDPEPEEPEESENPEGE